MDTMICVSQSRLIDAIDTMSDGRQLVEAAFMAAYGLPLEQMKPLHALLDVTSARLTDADQMLKEMLKAKATAPQHDGQKPVPTV